METKKNEVSESKILSRVAPARTVCVVCRKRKLRSGFTKKNMRAGIFICVLCESGRRLCSKCEKLRKRPQFTRLEWNKHDDSRLCQTCVDTGTILICSTCKEERILSEFTREERTSGSLECNVCQDIAWFQVQRELRESFYDY